MQRKPKGDIVLQLNQRSISHSSHSRSQNNNMVVLTEVTTLSHINGNLVQTHLHQTGGTNKNNLHIQYEGCAEAVDI